jgi:hypothetical protein
MADAAASGGFLACRAMKRYLKALAVVAAAALVTPGVASAQEKHYRLDAYDAHPAKPGIAGPTVTDAPLTDGVYYVAEVGGTISYYVKAMWTKPFAPFDDICGETAGRPRWYSTSLPHSRQGEVGMDAETVFARPCRGPDGAKAPAVGHWGNFEINSGDGTLYHHVDPLDGRRTSPTWSNYYDYPILGHGQPAKFHLLDLNGATRDNYGQLDIYIRVATGNDCSNGGGLENYKAFGFATAQDCWDHMYSGAQDADTYAAAVSTETASASRSSSSR